jgi:hypothetical protein
MSLFEVDSSNADLAEVYPTNDTTLHAGELVSFDSSITAGVKRSSSAYDRNVVGVISTSPSLLIGGKGDEGASGVPIALSGRVPVLVSDENGPIHAGDPLTTSSIPGMAMKATKSSYVIGRAMQDFQGTGQGLVMAFVGTHYYTPGDAVSADVPASLADLVKSDPAYVDAMKHFKTDAHQNLVTSLASAAKFAWSNTGGQVVAWVNDAGEGFFKGVQASLGTFGKLITGDLVFDKTAKLAGQSAIPSDKTELFVESNKVTADSIITLTPTSKTAGQNLYVKERRPGEGFVVALEATGPTPSPSPSVSPSPPPSPSPTPEPIQFNWLIVNQE